MKRGGYYPTLYWVFTLWPNGFYENVASVALDCTYPDRESLVEECNEGIEQGSHGSQNSTIPLTLCQKAPE